MGICMYFVTQTDRYGNDRTALECSPEAFQAYKEREVELCVQNIERMMDRCESVDFVDLHVSLGTWRQALVVLAKKERDVSEMTAKKSKYRK